MSNVIQIIKLLVLLLIIKLNFFAYPEYCIKICNVLEAFCG